jgi:hypothetical protein
VRRSNKRSTTGESRKRRDEPQLLRVARLDAVSLEVSETVDLRSVATEVAGYMAPLAVSQKRALDVQGIEQPVHVKGNRHARTPSCMPRPALKW